MQQVKDLMSRTHEAVGPQTNLHDVMKRMNRAGYRHVPVVEEGRLVGIITDRDIRLAINSPVIDEDADLVREAVLDGTKVGDCMTPEPQCVTSDTPLAEVAELLSLNRFGAMPVVDDGELVGMISTIDFLKHYAAHR